MSIIVPFGIEELQENEFENHCNWRRHGLLGSGLQ